MIRVKAHPIMQPLKLVWSAVTKPSAVRNEALELDGVGGGERRHRLKLLQHIEPHCPMSARRH